MILQVIAALITFVLIAFFAWYVTEKRRLIPVFLEYKPFNCRKCLTFWLGEALFLSIGIIYHLWVFTTVGCLITALNAIAMHVDEKKRMEEGNSILNG